MRVAVISCVDVSRSCTFSFFFPFCRGWQVEDFERQVLGKVQPPAEIKVYLELQGTDRENEYPSWSESYGHPKITPI